MLRARQFTTASRIVRSNYATSAAAAAHTSTKNIRSALISDFKSTDDQVTPSMRVRGPSRRLVAPQQLRREYPKQNGPAIFAMRARLGLAEMNLDLLKDICSKQSEKRDSYAEMGMRQLDNQIRQHLRHTYPNMPDLIIDRVRNALTESSVLHAVAGDFGVEHTIIESEMDAQYAQIVRAIIGAAVEINQAERLIKHHFLLRPIDWSLLLDFDYPDRAVEEMVREFYNTAPVTRLLSEGGRKSPMPIFVVGLFAGLNKIGEGFGQSISMAQHRARMDALRKHYLDKQPRKKIDASFK